MCVSLQPARLSRTILYGAEVIHPDSGQVVHVSGYQNQAENLADGPNAMILPFPAVPGSMSQHNVIDTKDCPHILQDMEKAILDTKMRSFSLGTKSAGSPQVEVFHHGIYTIVLAQDAGAIPGALHRVEEHKRPPLNDAIFEAYSTTLYPDWAIALCCFNNRDAQDATPMLWWYEPSDPGELFLPTLDCHTGDVPDLNAMVRLDHTIVLGSYRMEDGGWMVENVTYTDPIPASVQPFLLNQVIGASMNDLPLRARNGDFFVNTDTLAQGKFSLERRDPLGAVSKWM